MSGEVAASKPPVIRFVDLLLSQAVKSRASDIHIEPQEHSMMIRMRIDGLLRDMVPPARNMQGAVITRIKILSNMDIAERRLPQDGRIKMKIGKRKEMDYRVSVLPTLFGEKVVMRLLDKSNLQLDMTKLGFGALIVAEAQSKLNKEWEQFNLLKDIDEEIELENKLNDRLKEQFDWREKLLEASKKEIPEVAPELKLPSLEFILGGVPGMKMMTPEQKKAFAAYKKWIDDLAISEEKRKVAAENAKNAIVNFSSQIGDAFADMIMGTEVRWADMLKNMVKQMIASGIMNLIKDILSPIPGAGGVLGLLGFQHGTPYVPKTGVYMLHRGEAVVPAHRNVSYVRNYNSGGNTTNYNVLYLDPEKLTRRSIVPMIEKMVQNRQTRLVMG
jgi:hypothetical protein